MRFTYHSRLFICLYVPRFAVTTQWSSLLGENGGYFEEKNVHSSTLCTNYPNLAFWLYWYILSRYSANCLHIIEVTKLFPKIILIFGICCVTEFANFWQTARTSPSIGQVIFILFYFILFYFILFYFILFYFIFYTFTN